MAYTELAARQWTRGIDFTVHTLGIAYKTDTNYPNVGDSLTGWTETRLSPICVQVAPDYNTLPGVVLFRATWQGSMTQPEYRALA